MTLGERIKELREKRNLTQEILAQRCKVTRASISQWESDYSTPRGKHLHSLCSILKTSIDYLYNGKEKHLENDSMSDLTSDAIELILLIKDLDKKNDPRVKAALQLLTAI